MKARLLLLLFSFLCLQQQFSGAQSVLFDFNSGPQYSSLPLYQTAGGITAHFTATGQGFSLQNPSSSIGLTPAGFTGLCISPNSIYLSDLMISFSQSLSDLSIMYAPQELATDSSCTMKITAYLGTALVGSNTYQNPNPGTWPTGLLSISPSTPFDNVVIHYQSPPPTGGDYGVIFVADNLTVTAAPVPEPGTALALALGSAGLFLGRRLFPSLSGIGNSSATRN